MEPTGTPKARGLGFHPNSHTIPGAVAPTPTTDLNVHSPSPHPQPQQTQVKGICHVDDKPWSQYTQDPTTRAYVPPSHDFICGRKNDGDAKPNKQKEQTPAVAVGSSGGSNGLVWRHHNSHSGALARKNSDGWLCKPGAGGEGKPAPTAAATAARTRTASPCLGNTWPSSSSPHHAHPIGGRYVAI